jgi:hypothetical protein
MNGADVIPFLLLTLITTIGTGILIFVLGVRWASRGAGVRLVRSSADERIFSSGPRSLRSVLVQRPGSWLAVRSRDIEAVRSALALSNCRPCSWLEGLGGEQRLFIAPPVNGWILVIGSGLPDPADDVDVCFRFLTGLSRKLGRVQFFSASRILNHHAWARLDDGRVVRAYAWAGRTLWNQGVKTAGELELGLKCYPYFDAPATAGLRQVDYAGANAEKVPLLAARWSLDPAEVDERELERASGVAGDFPERMVDD